MQVVAPAVVSVSVTLPAAHVAQAFDASAWSSSYVPAAQGAHATVWLVHTVPAGHTVQVVAPDEANVSVTLPVAEQV